MSFLSKIRPSRNSVVVKDDVQLGDCDALKVRIDCSNAESHDILSDILTWPVTIPAGTVGPFLYPYCDCRVYGRRYRMGIYDVVIQVFVL